MNENLKKTVLIVDDEPDMRLAIRNVLKIRGYNVVESGDGNNAVEAVGKDNPDLILLDIRLPGMDGIEVLERIRKFNKNIPIVMITGYGHIQSAVDVMKLGAQEYLQKPFENAQLIEIVKRFTESPSDSRKNEAAYVPGPAAYLPSPETFAPVPAAGNSKRVPAYVLLLLLAAVLTFFFKLNLDKKNYKKVYPTDLENVSAVAVSGPDVFIGDWLKQRINRYLVGGGELKLVKSYELKDSHITSFAFAGDKFYLVDSWKQTLEFRNLDEELSVVKVHKMPLKITSVSFDGERLWLMDAEGKVSVHRPDGEFSPVSSFEIQKADEISGDGRYLWAVSGKDKKIYRYLLKGTPKLDGTFRLKYDGDLVSAFSVSGDKFYYTVDGRPEFIEINKAGLEKLR